MHNNLAVFTKKRVVCIPLCENLVIYQFILFIWNFVTKFWYYEKTFIKNIFTPLCLKSETSVDAQLKITCLHILFTSFMTWYLFESSIEDSLDK